MEKKSLHAFLGRRFSINFSVGGKAYVVGGSDATHIASSQVWCYDPSADSWTQKGNFPASLSSGCVFVINDTAYVGLG